jgi:hypothetical protein
VPEKKCEICGKEYSPVSSYKTAKYCSKTCYYKAQAGFLKKRGIFKGGYSRETHIRLWVDAMGIKDVSAPCHYCGEHLYPGHFVIEHRKPRRELKSKDEVKDISNLVISCHRCNKEKGTSSYEEFKCLKS